MPVRESQYGMQSPALRLWPRGRKYCMLGQRSQQGQFTLPRSVGPPQSVAISESLNGRCHNAAWSMRPIKPPSTLPSSSIAAPKNRGRVAGRVTPDRKLFVHQYAVKPKLQFRSRTTYNDVVPCAWIGGL